jgi:hypothetical protein
MSDLASIAGQMGITREELRSRIIRALQLSGVVPMEVLAADRADRLAHEVVIDIEIDPKTNQPRFFLNDPRTGAWRPL